MQFNSWIFLFAFLPVVLFGYFALSKYFANKIAAIFLTIASLCFYAYSNYIYVIYFAFCIVINYVIARWLIYSKKKWVLVIGLAFNLGILGWLKYRNFFASTMNSIFKLDFNLVELFIPLGISFFTFKFVALIYDCYEGKILELPFWKYVTFAIFFPKIIQGPIMYYQDFTEQCDLQMPNHFNIDNFAKGFYALTVGLGKKILIADVLGEFVDPAFASEYASYNSTMSILLMLAYTLQIYFDFSAYTDMARGISFMFNIELPRNIDSPYKALSIDSFWKRWHISLTSFFTKYLYIPLGGSRKGEVTTYINILIVFVLSGLWHGANYTFVLWGLIHGVAKVIERKWKFLSKTHVVIQWGYTFFFTNVAWIFFRSGTVKQVFCILKNIARCDFSGVNSRSLSRLILPEVNVILDILGLQFLPRIYPFLFLGAIFFAVLHAKNTDEKIDEFKPTLCKIFFTICIMAWSILSFGTKIAFIYEMF